MMFGIQFDPDHSVFCTGTRLCVPAAFKVQTGRRDQDVMFQPYITDVDNEKRSSQSWQITFTGGPSGVIKKSNKSFLYLQSPLPVFYFTQLFLLTHYLINHSFDNEGFRLIGAVSRPSPGLCHSHHNTFFHIFHFLMFSPDFPHLKVLPSLWVVERLLPPLVWRVTTLRSRPMGTWLDLSQQSLGVFVNIFSIFFSTVLLKRNFIFEIKM